MCVDSKDGVLLAQLADQLARLADLRRIESGRRLVEDQHRRDRRSSSVGQADALAIALRQRADELPAHVAEPAALHDAIDGISTRRPAMQSLDAGAEASGIR